MDKVLEKEFLKQVVLVRSHKAGVFMGTLKDFQATDNGYTVLLTDVTRIHHWKGANSLSELATIGVVDPKDSGNRFSHPTEIQMITEVKEIIKTTEKAHKNILSGVRNWFD